MSFVAVAALAQIACGDADNGMMMGGIATPTAGASGASPGGGVPGAGMMPSAGASGSTRSAAAPA